jgi:predicted DNA-binding protein (UPF0251 family)
MPRPCKRRRICALPQNCSFAPLGSEAIPRAVIVMAVDEFEAIRLIDLEGLTQEACALRMGVARTTAQAIYNSARVKLAECLVNGKELRIQGGDYVICSGEEQGCPHRHCHRRGCCEEKQEHGDGNI